MELLDTDLTQRSLYAFLEACCGQPITHGQRAIEATLPTPHIAELLDIDADLPVFKIAMPATCKMELRWEHSVGYHRSDRTLFEVQLVRNAERSLPGGYTLIE
ncbi:MAG: UTRA domain-containing protein [Anaerolineae bacterium]|nr:UTRA domain-containing protein [Anaerolineae bacterium]